VIDPAITPLDAWIGRQVSGRGKLTREAIEAYQLERLGQTLHLARSKSRFYQQRLKDAPEQLTSLSDLAGLPFTTAEELRTQGLQMVCVSQGDIQRVVTLDTSGTTGQPKRLYFTQADQNLTVDFFHIGMSTFTAPGDRVMILLPCERTGGVGDLLASALQRLGAHPIKHGMVRDVAQTLAVMRAEKVDILVGVPVQALWLALGSHGLRLKSALLTSDHVPDAIRRTVERAWGCAVYNHYGMTEMGLGGGVECQARRGYHLREADLYFEIVDPATGRRVPDGETGEVVFTTLTRQGMPLIRYRTGDISRFVPGACPCGTPLKTLERIRLRSGGQVSIGCEGCLSIADLDEALFSVQGVCDFDAYLAHGAGQDTLRLMVRSVAGGEHAGALEAALEKIPAVRLARAAQRLEIRIETGENRPLPNRAGKRAIQEI
jgi:phenylacetate-CoA ligase